MDKTPNFFGLMFVCDTPQKQSPNLRSSGNVGADALVYVKNAIMLARSLARLNYTFTLLTNQPDRVNNTLCELCIDDELLVKRIDFCDDIPRDIEFYAAHHKFDVFRYFSTADVSQYNVLVDLDVVALRQFPVSFLTLSSSGVPCYFDILSEIVPAHGVDRIRGDLSQFVLSERQTIWAGGEFIGGNSEFFCKLLARIDQLFPMYLLERRHLFHVGDEFLTTAAINYLLSVGHRIVNIRDTGVIARYWSVMPRHRQDKFTVASSNALLHLPADKFFLAELVGRSKEFDPARVLEMYQRYLKKGLLMNLVRRVKQVFLK